MKKKAFFGLIIFGLFHVLSAQCPENLSSYKFKYNGHNYILIKEALSWVDAAKCAVSKGGYLAQINNKAEQNYLFKQLKNEAQINLQSTIAYDGGGASYVWIGGTDLQHEGIWIWDGDHDNHGRQFWQGGINGHSIDHSYVNWGHEPDNFGGHQNALGFALTEWPLGQGNLGQPGEWNDLNEKDRLFFLIEINH